MMVPDHDLMYCNMDENCMGMECCITIEVLDLLAKTFKAYVRFDPDVPSLSFGFDKWSVVLDGSAFFGGMCHVRGCLLIGFVYYIRQSIGMGY